MRSKSTRNYYLTQYAYSSISREVSPKRDKRGILREELASETNPEQQSECQQGDEDFLGASRELNHQFPQRTILITHPSLVACSITFGIN